MERSSFMPFKSLLYVLIVPTYINAFFKAFVTKNLKIFRKNFFGGRLLWCIRLIRLYIVVLIKREPPTLLGRRSFLFPKGVFMGGCVRFRLSEASGGMIDAYGGNNEGFL